MTKRATQIHAILAITQPGDVVLDTDAQFVYPGRRVVDVVDEPVEGIPAICGLDGFMIPLVRVHTTPTDLEDFIRLGELAVKRNEAPDRLEVVRFTMRHHVTWIER